MKRISKKCGLFAVLTAGLLVTAVLITACVNPADTDGAFDLRQGYQPPPGMGSVRLSINDTVSRSIMPTSVPAIVDYIVTFTKDGTALAPLSPIIATNISNDIDLDSGVYSVAVVARLAAGAEIASGTSSPFTIVAGATSQSVNVALTLLDPALAETDQDGSFYYSITIPSNATSASMQIDNLPGTTTYADIPLNTGVNTDTITALEAGYYTVVITMSDGANIASFRQILHIYQHITSSFTHVLTNDHLAVAASPTQGPASIIISGPSIVDGIFGLITDAGDTLGTFPETPITLSKTSAGGIADEADITSLIPATWVCNGVTITGTTTTTITIEAGTVPFADSKTYDVSLVTTAGVPYSTFFRVIIID